MKDCCMCGKSEGHLIERRDGDEYCDTCQKEHCEHLTTETVSVGGEETVTVCHDCGEEL